MPTSRTRRTRNRSNSDRQRERARKARAERAASRAAAEGQLDGACALQDAILTADGVELSHGLRQLEELGDDAPAWAWSRWIQAQAFRWDSPTSERRRELALVLALDVAYVSRADPARPFGLESTDLATLVKSRDWIVRQLVLFELGGLGAFVRDAAGEDLLARAEPMVEWTEAHMGAYQFVDETPDCTRMLDLETEEYVEVLNIGSVGAIEPDGFVLGRLVPIASEPGLMFESRPLEVDERTARQIAERWESQEERWREDDCGCDPDECDGFNCDPIEHEPPNWWDLLQDACDEGRVPPLFSLHSEYTLLTDVPTLVWARASDDAPDSELIRELVGAGTPRLVAEAVQVCVDALAAAPVYGKGLTAGGPIYGAVLLEPGVMEVLTERFTLPQYAAGWRALAELVVEPARSRCLSLAEACSRFGCAEDSEAEPVDIIEQVFPAGT